MCSTAATEKQAQAHLSQADGLGGIVKGGASSSKATEEADEQVPQISRRVCLHVGDGHQNQAVARQASRENLIEASLLQPRQLQPDGIGL